jgi:hypothetical protein
MRKSGIPESVCLLLGLAVCAQAAEITGVLLDEKGRPVPNRLVHFYHGTKAALLSAKTDQAGKFATGGQLAGPCQLVVAEEADGGPLSRVVFLAKDIELKEGESRAMDFRITRQQPTPDNEEALRLLGCDWPLQTVSFEVSPAKPAKKPRFLKTWHEAAVQVSEVRMDDRNRVVGYRANCRAGVRTANGRLEWVTELGDGEVFQRKTEKGIEIGNGKLSLVVPDGTSPRSPPILSARGADGVWFGWGRWQEGYWDSCLVESFEQGPVFARYRVTYGRNSGEIYVVWIALSAGDDFLRIDERASRGLNAAWEFDLSEGYGPDRQRQYRYYAAQPPAELPAAPAVLASIQPWTFVGIMDFRETVAVYRNEGRNDAVAVFSVDGSDWTTEGEKPFSNYADFSSRNGWRMPADTTAARLVLDDHRRVVIRYPVQAGRRITGWAIYDRRYDATRHKALDARHILSDTPLSDVLKMKLAWDKPIAAPALHGGLEEWRKLLPLEGKDPTPYGYLSGARDRIPGLRATVLGKARSMVNYFRYPDAFDAGKPPSEILGYVGLGQRSIQVGPQARQFAEAADYAFAMGVLSAEEQGIVRAALAFMAYKLADTELYASMNALGNFKVDGYFGLMMLALTLKEHPDFGHFWRHYLRQLKQDVEDGVYLFQDGGTNECPIYVLMAMNFLAKQAWYLRLHRMDYDLLSQPRFKRVLEAMAEWTTPPIKGLNDSTPRVLPLIGDTTVGGNPFGLFGPVAAAAEKTDPEFAGEMLWFWDFFGKPGFAGHGENCTAAPSLMYSRQLAKSQLKAVAAGPFGSRAIDGFGALLRKNWNTPDEFMFLMKAGRSSGHDHPDDGGFVLFAWNKCLSTGYGKYPYMTTSWRYNLVRFDGRSNWSRGEVTGFLGSDACDALTAHIPVVNLGKKREMLFREQWETNKQFFEETWDEVEDVEPSWFDRTVVFNRPDQYLVVYDVTGPHYRTDWFAHVMSDDWTAQGSTVSLPGREGVGVDIHVLKPAGAVPEVIPVFKKLFAKELAESGGKSPRYPGGPDQTVLRLQQGANSEYLAIWHPRKPGVTQPLSITPGKVTKIQSASGTSLFACEREAGDFREGGFALKGSCGYLIRAAEPACLGLLKGTEVGLDNQQFRVTEGTRLQAVFAAGKLVSVQISAPKEAMVAISLPASARLVSKDGTISVEGRELAVRVPAGQTTLDCR